MGLKNRRRSGAGGVGGPVIFSLGGEQTGDFGIPSHTTLLRVIPRDTILLRYQTPSVPVRDLQGQIRTISLKNSTSKKRKEYCNECAFAERNDRNEIWN